MFMKTKELGWKENHGIQDIGINDSKGNVIVGKRQVVTIWENFTEFYDRTNRPENVNVEPGDADERGPYILRSKVEKVIK